MHSGESSKHWFAWICLILVLGVAGGVIWYASGERQGTNVAQLPDGTMVEFVGTVVGKNQFTKDPGWARVARRYLPSQLKKWIPAAIISGCSFGSTNALGIYLRILGTNRPAGGKPWTGFAAEDDTGFRYPGYNGYCSSTDSAGQLVYGLNMTAYPRRQREFLFHLLGQKDEVIATFRVPNPNNPGPFPVWQPAPLPQTRTNGPVSLTLKSLAFNGKWLKPQWQLSALDPTWASAKPRYSSYNDATGNEGYSILSRREPAWKLHTVVFRERLEDFAPHEQVVLTNVPVPGAGKFVSIDKIADCNGVIVNTLVLAGAGTFGISNGVTRFMNSQVSGGGHSTHNFSSARVEEWSSSTPFLMVEVQGVQEADSLEFRVKEDTGKDLKAESNGFELINGGGRRYTVKFTPSAECKSVTVRTFVNRPLEFDFMVNPADVGGDKMSR